MNEVSSKRGWGGGKLFQMQGSTRQKTKVNDRMRKEHSGMRAAQKGMRKILLTGEL